MKKLGLFFAIVSSLLLTSCSKDVEDNLPGTWNATVTQTVLTQSISFSGTMTFNEDGTGSSVLDGDSDTFTWSLNDEEELTIDNDLTLGNDTNEEEKQVFSGTQVDGGVSYDVLLSLTK